MTQYFQSYDNSKWRKFQIFQNISKYSPFARATERISKYYLLERDVLSTERMSMADIDNDDAVPSVHPFKVINNKTTRNVELYRKRL
jgi:hypothetical protein